MDAPVVNGRTREKENEDTDPDTECGIGSFKPRCIQGLANIGVFVGLYSVVGTVSQTLSVYVNSQVPMLEKQFGINSAQSGLLMSCNDIGYFLFVLFAASFARFVHVPRTLGACIALYGISGIMCSIPHFISVSLGYISSARLLSDAQSVNNVTDSTQEEDDSLLCRHGYNSTKTLEDICNSAGSQDSTSVLAAPAAGIQNTAIALIGIGMFLQGIGKAPRYPLFALYVDDNGDRRKVGFYAGVVIALSIFGPALSYGFGGLFSSMYVTLEDVDMSTRDPRWIGAWWLGFFVFGITSLFVTIPLFFFPRRMKLPPEALKKGKEYKRSEHVEGTLVEKMKDRLLSFWRILKKPVFVFTVIGNTSLLLSVGGFLAFMSKYITSQFNIPLSLANYILAGTNLASVALGTFFGGLLTRKIPMTPKNAVMAVCILYSLASVIFLSGFGVGCEQPRILGPGRIHDESNDISNFCGSDCQCSEEDYFPICGSNGMTYHSPCYAGCNEAQRGGRLFSNCTCIPDGMASAGLCPSGCKRLPIWAIINTVASLIGSLAIPFIYIVFLRSVGDKDKSTAVGLSSFTSSAFGWALGPVLYGRLVDTSCKIWQSPCGSRGACELYDIVDFRIKIYSFTLVFRVISFLFLAVSLYKVWNWTKWESEDEKENVAIHHQEPGVIEKTKSENEMKL